MRPLKLDDLINHQCLVYQGLHLLCVFCTAQVVTVLFAGLKFRYQSIAVYFYKPLLQVGIARLPLHILISSHIEDGELIPLTMDGRCVYPTHGPLCTVLFKQYKNQK